MTVLAAELPASAVDPDLARRTADEVLARSEYAGIEPTLLQRAWGWVAEQLGRALDALGGSGQARLVGTLLLLVGVAAVAILAARFARGVRRDPEVAAATTGPVGRAGADWAAEASAHEQAGRWREAVRCRYREVVADLAGAGLVDEVPGRTAGEYLAEVRDAAPAAGTPFAAMTGAFEEAWYGNAAVAEGDLRALREDAGRLRRVTGLRSRQTVGAGA